MQCVGTPACTRDANNRDVECTLKQWLRFLYTEMVDGVRGNIGGGNSYNCNNIGEGSSYNCNNIGGGNSYNCNTFSLRRNWYHTDTISRPRVNIILHTSLQAYKKMYLHLIPTVIISGNSQRAVHFSYFNSNSICFDCYQFNSN